MDSEFKWPEVGDKMFAGNGSYDKTAFVGPNRVDWMLMAGGYIRSAELAVIHCDRIDRNLVIYPVVFQVRHAIELSLKHLLFAATALYDEPPIRSNHHRLLDLWRAVRPLIERRWPESTGNELTVVEAMIRELNSADQNAENYRYPVCRNGTSVMKEDRAIDLEQFIVSGRKVFNFLDGCSDGILDALEIKRDFERDARGF